MAANTIILGAGVIGLSTAYYLARHQPPSTIHLVESSPELFSSASGYAAGFLARDWFGPGSASLGALSFDEHRRLAAAHNGAERWGYRRSTAVSYTPGGDARAGARGPRGEDWLRSGASRATTAGAAGDEEDEADRKDDDGGGFVPPWLRRERGDEVRAAGDPGTTAQLDPRRLCRFLLDECARAGVRLHHPARAAAALADLRGELSSVRIEDLSGGPSPGAETDVPCTRLIIAAGAWSARVFAGLFPASASELPVSGLAGHSLVVRSPRWTERMEAEAGGARAGCHAVFTTAAIPTTTPRKKAAAAAAAAAAPAARYSPEVFSRAGAEIWVGGLNSATTPLPPGGPAEVRVEPEAIAQIRRTAAWLLGPQSAEETEKEKEEDGGEEDDDLEVVREALCFRPVTPYGTPIISRVDDSHLGGGIATRPDAEGGVFLVAGHGPWGISLSLGTGIVLAEMVQGRKLSADVSSLAMW